jgi:hypothetical protein
MNSRLMFRPDLAECVLEDRALLATPNLGIIILTSSGYALVTPFPGANSSAGGSLGSNGPSGGSASGVSGVPIPTGLFITGSGGISSLRPGNITGVPSLGGTTSASGGAGASVQVGSGADDANAPISNSSSSINPVSRNFFADPMQRPILTQIGGSISASSSPVLPPGQSYRDTAPVPPPMPYGVMNQSASDSTDPSRQSSAPNPQLGAPTLGPFNRSRNMTGPLPGSLVPVTPLLPGSN